ncbi:MAG: Cl-channel, voltage-gated family protein [Magnetococcales bacterium]|nr:Cl-channel, voltage-gated family protein [Magnetococcales bacterium]HIJ83132.1 chloride channel protein [Magnetococcales bacterium]
MLKFIQRLGINEHIVLSVIAIAIGLMVGYGAILFRLLIEGFQFLFMASGNENVAEIVRGLSWWHVLFMPVLGGAIIGPLVHFFFPSSRGDGVPEVMSAVALRGGKLGLREGLGKMLSCSLSIGCGGSVGREGPVVHLGATLASWFGSLLPMSNNHMRTIVGCGAAAGIAASFNAPIAGVMFALEVILADYGLATFSPIVLSSVVATVIARMHLGDFPAFIVPNYTLVSAWEIPAYVGLGLVCGLTGILFMVTLFKMEDLFATIKIPIYLKPIIGGFCLGVIALVFPETMGVGYDIMNHALLEEMAVLAMIALIFAKIIATSIALGSGFSGGVFTPSLFLGAMVGGSFGTIAHSIFPAISAGPGAYTLVGMGAMAAAVLGAPIASILILFELTGDYRIMLALMVASIVATLLINQIYRESVYTKTLKRKKIDLRQGREANLLRNIPVSSIIRKDFETIQESMNIRQFKDKIRESQQDCFIVVAADGHLKGIISFQDIRKVAFAEGEFDDLALIKDFYIPNPATIHPNENLYDALLRFEANNVEQLPVVAPDDPTLVIGLISIHNMIRAYNMALLSQNNPYRD